MSKNIHSSKRFELVEENNQFFVQFTKLKDQPRFYFESLENYLYETQGIQYVEDLAKAVLKKPAEYDQRLRYENGQSISPPRECFYLGESYYMENNNRKSKSFLDNVKYLIGMYSDGASQEGMAKYLDGLLKDATYEKIDLANREHYYLFSSFICLISLLEIEFDQENEQLKKLVSQDRLLELYYYQRKVPNIDVPILHQDPYLFISLELTREDDKIEQYCINFYHSMKSVPWYESHRKDFASFFGYWSFELAYIVRFLDVNDAHFLDHMYYPRDLAQRKFLPTWKDNKNGEEARIYKEQFLEQKQTFADTLIKEVIEFVENDMQGSISTILSSDILKKAMQTISESSDFFESISKDPTEKEFVKIRSFVSDLVDILSDFSGEIDRNNHLKKIEEEIKYRVIKQFQSKENSQESIDAILSQYFESSSFERLVREDKEKMNSFSEKLLTAQKIEDAGEYWDDLGQIFEEYGLIEEEESTGKSVIKKEKKTIEKSKKATDVSFRISFNDYLKN